MLNLKVWGHISYCQLSDYIFKSVMQEEVLYEDIDYVIIIIQVVFERKKMEESQHGSLWMEKWEED